MISELCELENGLLMARCGVFELGWIQGRGAVVGFLDGVLSVLTVWLNAEGYQSVSEAVNGRMRIG